MKTRIFAILCVLLLSAALIGCEEETTVKEKVTDGVTDKVTDTVSDKMTKGAYSGFMAWKEGMWAESVMKSQGQEMTTRMELVGLDNDVMMFQYVFTAPGEGVERVSQIWMDKKTNKPVKYVMDMGTQIVCLDVGDIPEDSTPADSSAYPSDFPDLRYDKYTVKGKTVDCAIFEMGGSEVWVSSEVPFGMVKMVAAGRAISELKDFGLTGAKSRISKSKADNCVSMDQMANQMMAQMQQQAAPSPMPDAEATATYRGEEQQMPCSMCANMPDAAKNACLTACSG